MSICGTKTETIPAAGVIGGNIVKEIEASIKGETDATGNLKPCGSQTEAILYAETIQDGKTKVTESNVVGENKALLGTKTNTNVSKLTRVRDQNKILNPQKVSTMTLKLMEKSQIKMN